MLTAILRCAGQSRASRNACSMTLIDSCPIRPVVSAASRKASGSSKPRSASASGRAPRSRPAPASSGRSAAGRMARTRRSDAAANIFFELEPVGQFALERLVEPGQAVPARPLGRIERDVALPQHGLHDPRDLPSEASPIEAEIWAWISSIRNGVLELLDQRLARCASARPRSSPSSSTANSSPPIRAQHASPESCARRALGDCLQQLVADVMAVKVVDPLEVIEVDHAPALRTSATPMLPRATASAHAGC